MYFSPRSHLRLVCYCSYTAFLSLPSLQLLSRQLSACCGSSPGNVPSGQKRVFFANRPDLQLPKNSFLASSPKGELNPLPDKDAVKLTLSEASQNIEVYYLRRGRLSVVRGFLAQSSKYDVFVAVFGVLFWPVAALTVGVFHKQLADTIVQGLARLFRPKTHRQIGFRASDSKKD